MVAENKEKCSQEEFCSHLECKSQFVTSAVCSSLQRTVSTVGNDTLILILAPITWQEQLMLCVLAACSSLHFKLQNSFQIPTKYAASQARAKREPLLKKQINKSRMHFDYSTL